MPKETNTRTILHEAVHLIVDEKENVIGFIRRDPVSKKSIMYVAEEANCDDIATKLL